MIETCRLTIPYQPERRMMDCANEMLESVGLTYPDIEIKNPYEWHNSGSSTHLGNWCIVSIRYLPALEKLHDMRAWQLEKSDIEALAVGDKVKIQYTGGLCNQQARVGRVLKVVTAGDGEYFIPYAEIIKTRGSKGWRLYAGDSAAIWKG